MGVIEIDGYPHLPPGDDSVSMRHVSALCFYKKERLVGAMTGTKRTLESLA